MVRATTAMASTTRAMDRPTRTATRTVPTTARATTPRQPMPTYVPTGYALIGVSGTGAGVTGHG